MAERHWLLDEIMLAWWDCPDATEGERLSMRVCFIVLLEVAVFMVMVVVMACMELTGR